MLRLLSRSGFAIAVFVIFGVLIFAKVSIDKTSVENVVFVGDLTDGQLVELRSELIAADNTVGDAEAIRTRLSSFSWVHHVNVRRKWPSTLMVEVHPEQVMAYWNDDGFINNESRVIVTDQLAAGDLPLLYGPEGTETDVMSRYQQLNRMLLSHGHEIRVLKRSDRGSWSIETRGRVQILLGKEDLKARMDRFLDVSNELQRLGDNRIVSRMDARYVNGVAVRFNGVEAINLGSL